MKNVELKKIVNQIPQKIILIIFDDEDTSLMLTELLTMSTSFQIAVASDGKTALHFMRNIKPHLLIIDGFLPTSNGIQLYDRIQANSELNTIPIIFMSASLHSFQDQLNARKMIGVNKPFDLDELLAIIENILPSS